ncbi:hypothetical protein CTA2_8574 [Colletotrichum tanaceti]|uniref:Uncharacterized protein n=1 Tax=Colletotrichum tanaceti TaxID=1306861 RepID=A0A4V6DHR7_9PEZI|nr:hypothetical protein CTA2_8574 [Colletotrichum tanaceti]TKW51146.1 hypothetical protein CTA1_12711 [Colletotrichum tanaceti]
MSIVPSRLPLAICTAVPLLLPLLPPVPALAVAPAPAFGLSCWPATLPLFSCTSPPFLPPAAPTLPSFPSRESLNVAVVESFLSLPSFLPPSILSLLSLVDFHFHTRPDTASFSPLIDLLFVLFPHTLTSTFATFVVKGQPAAANSIQSSHLFCPNQPSPAHARHQPTHTHTHTHTPAGPLIRSESQDTPTTRRTVFRSPLILDNLGDLVRPNRSLRPNNRSHRKYARKERGGNINHIRATPETSVSHVATFIPRRPRGPISFFVPSLDFL